MEFWLGPPAYPRVTRIRATKVCPSGEGRFVPTTRAPGWSEWHQALRRKDESRARVWLDADGSGAGDAVAVGLWRSDGTAAGTVAVKKVRPTEIADANGTLLFAGDDGSTGGELWKSDGTEAGTLLVKDLVLAGSSLSPLSRLIDRDGMLLFTADDGVVGTELWSSDGTE